MLKLGSILVATIAVFGCSNNLRTIGLVNNTDKEVTIDTSPSIRYSGLPEKYIGLEKDASNRGRVWKFGPINCIIVHPMGSQPAYDSIGKYIMKPKSGFGIGDFFKRKDGEFSSKCISINYLRIITARDTITLSNKEMIWEAINHNRKTKGNRKFFYDKALVIN